MVLECCRKMDCKLVTAESCTGGLIGAVLTAIPGSSDVVDRGFITYSNGAKVALLGVQTDALDAHGAVSETVALQMAAGSLARSDAHISVAVTGVAGPGGGTAEKPVGLVYIATARADSAKCNRHIFSTPTRDGIRRDTVLASFAQMLDHLEE
ncbi:MAG: CinA family protein [Pseudomonadota bacterium]